MIDPKASDDQKLATAKELAEEANEHYQQCNDERALCARFYHNTGGIGQWKEKDLDYLKRQGRSPITHNVLKTKVKEWLTSGPWRKWVIAFTSARACDGGTGATYVLLRQRPATKRYRRQHRKKPMSRSSH